MVTKYSNRHPVLRLVFWPVLALAAALILATAAAAVEDVWETPGNTDLNIINGGTMLTLENDFYYSEGGAIYHETVEETVCLVQEAGANLNLVDGWLYYTLDDGSVRRIPEGGGEPETVWSFGSEIDQLYVIGDTFRFLANGQVYTYNMMTGESALRSTRTDIKRLIPTEYGDIYLTGEVFAYTVYAGENQVLTGVTGCYTDSGYLVINMEEHDHQVALADLFSGSFTLEDFDLHGGETLAALFSLEEEHTCAVCEANGELYAGSAAVQAASGDDVGTDIDSIVPEVSQGQKNMVLRARQLHEIKWTPLADRYQWGYRGTFYAGTTISGLPYGQPVNNGGYVGYNVSLETFAAAVRDNTSKFYTTYSTYNKIAPAYSTDCSGFVSYAWGLTNRHTTYTWANIATKVSDQSIYSLQVGDALNHTTSHIVLVSDVQYDSEGNIVKIVIMEQTPVKTKLTEYGAGCTYPLSRIQSYYLNGGYAIYRYEDRDSVTYTHSCAVPLDGDYCANCKAEAPYGSTTSAVGSKTLTLTHSDSSAVIYYTTDGSEPTTSSARYTGPLTFTSTTTVKAMAVTSSFSSGFVLTYKVSIEPAEAPTASVYSGTYYNNLVSAGSTISLSSGTSGATIYYTTDGSTPTTSSTRYTGPIPVSQDTTIRAIAIASGYTASDVATFSYQIGNVYTITASAGSNGSISPSGSVGVMETSSKTFTFTPSSGYAVSNVVVDGVSQGAISSYTFSNISGNHTISVTFQFSSSMPFTDVSSSDWYYEAVGYAYNHDLVKGISSTQFGPNTTMTRAMFTTVLGRMAGNEDIYGNIGILTGSDVNLRREASTSSTSLGLLDKYSTGAVLGTVDVGSYTWYKIQVGDKTGYVRGDLFRAYSSGLSDLPNNEYYTGHAQWAYLTGILDGVASGGFQATANITREDMALMIYNYVEAYGIDLPTVNNKTTFTDDASISSSAHRTAIYALQQAGVINGMGDGTYAPKSTANRAQVAQIFMNLLKAMG